MRYILVVSTMVLLGMAGFAADEKSEPKAGDIMSVDIGGGVKMDFVWCPPGEFMMGSPESEAKRSESEGPQHTVTFKQGFWMGKYEVTQGQWKSVMGSNPSNFKGSDSLPVDTVSWNDCQEFLQKLNAKGSGIFRLPSESQWEYACRAGTSTPFSFGETISTDQANYDGSVAPYGNGHNGVSLGKTSVVGTFPPNAWNLCDMHGNLYEWCQDWYYDSYSRNIRMRWHDWYHGSFTGAPTDGSAWESPAGTHRVIRGGAWDRIAYVCRSAFRNGSFPDNRLGEYGGNRLLKCGLRLVYAPVSR